MQFLRQLAVEKALYKVVGRRMCELRRAATWQLRQPVRQRKNLGRA